MFAKPPSKKTETQASGPKSLPKPKTVSVKTGVKGQQTKKIKSDNKSMKSKPASRPDPGYSLYSTADTADQVSDAFCEIEACEKILTQLKHASKHRGKPKAKKKNHELSSPKETHSLPRALNDNPAVFTPSDFDTQYGTVFPFGAGHFLKNVHSQDYANNPIFNSRLTSSTPDPDKQQTDLSTVKLLADKDQTNQDLPDHDISEVSSVPPSFNHLQNIADMLDIYKHLEYNHFQQIQEVATNEELKKLQNRLTQPLSAGRSCSNIEMDHNVQNQIPALQAGITNSGQVNENRLSEGFVVTDGLGFSMSPSLPTNFHSVPVTSATALSDMNAITDSELSSSLAPLQTYVNNSSVEIIPPQGWVKNSQQGSNSVHCSKGQGVDVSTVLCDAVSNNSVNPIEMPDTGRSEKSNASVGMHYVQLPRNNIISDGQIKVSSSRPEVSHDTNIMYTQQNGLFQIYRMTEPNSNESKSDNSDSTRNNAKAQSVLDKVPERDIPVSCAQNVNTMNSHLSSKNGTFRIELPNDTQTPNSPDISAVRNQNASGNGSSSAGGKIVFIPNDSGSQSLLGYVPGFPMIPVPSQLINWPVKNDGAPVIVQTAGSGNSSLGGLQGPAILQVLPQVPHNLSGSCCQSSSYAQVIAAGDIGIRKLRYLLKELKKCTKVAKDVKICRLVKEIDEAINAIPQLASTFNIQTEIDLAMQPLRSENSQLRRKLRLLNQQLKDRDLADGEKPKDVNVEILQLKTINETLQKVIKDEKEIKTRMASEIQYLYAEIQKMKVEKSKLVSQTSEKETEQLKHRQELNHEIQKCKHELDFLRKDHEIVLNKLEGVEKENHILQITVQQRDTEIDRLHEILQSMKESIYEFLDEIEQTRVKEKVWDHNSSNGLHRLLKILDEESSGYANDIGLTTRKKQKFKCIEETTSTAHLTRAALAYHDRKHVLAFRRMGADGRIGPASESELDMLVDMQSNQRLAGYDQDDLVVVDRRRTSSSSPVRLRNEPVTNLQHQFAATSAYKGERHRNVDGTAKNHHVQTQEKTVGHGGVFKEHEHKNSEQKKNPAQKYTMFSHPKQLDNNNYKMYNSNKYQGQSEGTEFSYAQSRYSVTDYFKKYHPEDPSTRRKQVYINTSSQPYHPEDPSTRQKQVYTNTSHPCLNVQSFREALNRPAVPLKQFRTSSEIDAGTIQSLEEPTTRNVQQMKSFKVIHDDRTVSAIDDDNLSSVSMATANTVDDSKFRKGIATLDANIAKLHQALQKTKLSMLS